MQGSLRPKLGMLAQRVKRLRQNFPYEISQRIPHNRNPLADRAEYARFSGAASPFGAKTSDEATAMSGPQTREAAHPTHSPRIELMQPTARAASQDPSEGSPRRAFDLTAAVRSDVEDWPAPARIGPRRQLLPQQLRLAFPAGRERRFIPGHSFELFGKNRKSDKNSTFFLEAGRMHAYSVLQPQTVNAS